LPAKPPPGFDTATPVLRYEEWIKRNQSSFKDLRIFSQYIYQKKTILARKFSYLLFPFFLVLITHENTY